MVDKAKLTLETAIEEFPRECRAVLGIAWMLVESWLERSRDATCVVSHDEGMNLFFRLHVAGLEWLAGKRRLMRRAAWRSWVTTMSIGVQHGCVDIWPEDYLRFCLEEVREQLKQERRRVPPLSGVKVVVHSSAKAKSGKEE